MFKLFGCPVCRRRWWTKDDEPNPGHDCPAGAPAGGLLVTCADR